MKQLIDKKPSTAREAAWGDAHRIFSSDKKWLKLPNTTIYQSIQNKTTAKVIKEMEMQDSALLGDHGGQPVLTFGGADIKPLGIIEYARNNNKQDLLNAIFNRPHAHKKNDIKRLELAIACNQKDYVEQHKKQFPEHASGLFHYAIRCGNTAFAETFLLEVPEEKRQASYQQGRKLVHPLLPSTEDLNKWLDSVKNTGLTEQEQDALGNLFLVVAQPQIPSHSVTFYLRLLKENLTALNNKDETGKTPLMLAALTNNHNALEILIAAGADPAIKDNDGKTANDLYKKMQEDSFSSSHHLQIVPKETPENRLKLAVEHGLSYVVETLLKEHPKLIRDNKNLLKLLPAQDNYHRDYAQIRKLLEPERNQVQLTSTYEKVDSFSDNSSLGPATPSSPISATIGNSSALRKAAEKNDRSEITRLMVSGQRFAKNEEAPGDFRTRHHIQKLSIKLDHKVRRYAHHMNNVGGSDMEKARALLDNYANGGGIKHHRQAVKEILGKIKSGEIVNPKNLLAALRNIKLENEGGSLARRIAFIAKELNGPEAQPEITMKPS